MPIKEGPLPTERDRKLRRAQRLLKSMRDTAKAAGDSPWWRTHDQIIRPGKNGGEVVALADGYEFLERKGVTGFSINKTMDGKNSRHIVATCPKTIVDLIDALLTAFPELSWEETTDAVRQKT